MHNNIIFNRVWNMPNKNTFDIKCVKELIMKYFKEEYLSIDLFANKSRIAKITNDINPEMETDYNLDALDFCKIFEDDSVDFVLYDPPFTSRQVSECYKRMGRTFNMETTQASF